MKSLESISMALDWGREGVSEAVQCLEANVRVRDGQEVWICLVPSEWRMLWMRSGR